MYIYIIFYLFMHLNIFIVLLIVLVFFIIGDWGLGIGDWAQSPIPNPQSPKYKNIIHYINIFILARHNILIKNI